MLTKAVEGIVERSFKSLGLPSNKKNPKIEEVFKLNEFDLLQMATKIKNEAIKKLNQEFLNSKVFKNGDLLREPLQVKLGDGILYNFSVRLCQSFLNESSSIKSLGCIGDILINSSRPNKKSGLWHSLIIRSSSDKNYGTKLEINHYKVCSYKNNKKEFSVFYNGKAHSTKPFQKYKGLLPAISPIIIVKNEDKKEKSFYLTPEYFLKID